MIANPDIRLVIQFTALTLFATFVGCDGGSSASMIVRQPVDDFEMVERSGEAITLADLKGKRWIANFMFTSCGAECPILLGRMAEIQAATKGLPDVALVSFTVDPRTDTLPQLRKYAERWKADPNRWFFVTGNPPELDQLIRQNFLLPFARTEKERMEIAMRNLVHSNKFVLVNKDGIIVDSVDGMSPDAVEKTLVKLQALESGTMARSNTE